MKLHLHKFGTTLASRQAGREAYNAVRPLLSQLPSEELVEVIFDGVITFSPSWADEFLTPLKEQFHDRLILDESTNPSVKATLELLGDIHKFQF